MSLEEVPTRITPPECIELKVSKVNKKRIGCFSLISISKGTEFGPYEGRIVYDKENETVDPRFSWEVFDLETFKYVHTVDATNPDDGNWMRYVCCARYFEEQNIVSTQNGTEVYYRALKDIEAGEELLTWFQPKKKKRKRSSLRNSLDSIDLPTPTESKSSAKADTSVSPSHGHEKQKRRRKPKVIPDAYVGPLDWEEQETLTKKIKEDEFEPLQPGQKRRRRKKLPSEDTNSEATSISGDRQSVDEIGDEVVPNIIKVEEKTSKNKENEGEEVLKNANQGEPSGNTDRKSSSPGESKKEAGQTLTIAEINNSVEWEYPKPGEEYSFELKKYHIVTEKAKKLYKCDICLGLYKHMFSLKRHYLRNHVNYRYLSKSDMTNCLINLAQVKQMMLKKFPVEAECPESESGKLKENRMNGNIDHAESMKNETADEDYTNNEDSSQMCVQETDVDSEQFNKRETDNSSVVEEMDNERNKENSERNAKETVLENDVKSKVDNNSVRNVFEMETVSEDNVHSSVNDNSNESTDHGASDAEVDHSDSKIQEFGTPNMKGAGKDKNVPGIDSVDTQDKNDATETSGRTQTNILMPGLFRCYTCYVTFDDIEGIREHTQNHPDQMDGACFPCDLCSMRFNYKHNLVRHKKTHETEEITKKKSPDVKVASEKIDKPSPKKHLLPVKNQSPQEKKPLLLPTVFRCGICPQKFDTQARVVKHVEEEHKNGSKFQCIYCGKDFQSMPNMKKHVRFHLGYRATCRICSEAFSNVGALRKHTRVSHPDIYKAKLIERLEKYGVLKGPDKNALSKDIIEKVNLSRKNLKETTDKVDTEPVESVKKEIKTEAIKEVKEEEIDHEINFSADEIDDGGSRFKFACTVCKKRFSSYINMCRHRRKVHSNENRNKTEQCLTFGRKPRNNPSPVLENPAEIAAFYANVSHNIATNLNCYIDGKPESLKTYTDHIKIEGYTGNFGYSAENDKPLDLTWERYNFPHDYKPVETISFADIKNVLNLHNDFDSHCVSVEARSPESAHKDSEAFKDTKTVTAEGESVKNLKEEKDNADKSTESKVTEETLEDKEVKEINSAWLNKDLNCQEKCGNISETATMGKTSHGLKVLASLGSVLAKKGALDANNEGKSQDVGVFSRFKITDGKLMCVDSPATKTFHQVKLGEYANFQDELLSFDMECPVAKETLQVSRIHALKNGEYGESDESRKCQVEETKSLVKDAQDELEALYDSIESCEPITRVYTKSPISLSALCEKVLGLGHTAKELKTSSSLNVEVADQLKLAENQAKGTLASEPDYSDAPEESPFYNYDMIAFGRNGHVQQVCAVCKKHFADFDALLRHHAKKHPASECSFLEVEQGNEIEDLHFSDPSQVGALAVTDPGLDNVLELDSFKCTSCDASFKTVSKLHIHILNCSSIDPLYGVQKTSSPAKTPLKKKLQRKIFSMFGNKADGKTDLNYTHFKLSQQRGETQSPKRVFTGCRKRTSVILPDSPQKLVCEQKTAVPSVSGYNPQNHVRRRELTELLDTLTCEACGLKFKTIIILERHIKYCTKKEKFKSIQPMACPLIDESLEKIKNMCFYCNKNFTYTKSLLNHFQDFCPVKRSILDKGELTEQHKVRENEIIERIQKADEEKKEMENRPKKKITWQVGRKPKRKGHSWTNIKKRSQPKQSANGLENHEENEVFDSSGSGSEIEDSEGTQNDADDVKENLNSRLDNNISKSKCDNESGNKVENASEESQDLLDSCDTEVVGKDLANDNTPQNKVAVFPSPVISEEKAAVAVSLDQETNKHCDISTGVLLPQDAASDETTNTECIEQSFSETDEPLKLDLDINNTSLNCTARYKVNQVKCVTKYRPIAPKPRASSVIFQCVSKGIPTSEQIPLEHKNESVKSKLLSEIRSEKETSDSVIHYSNNNVQASDEAAFHLAQQGLVSGKRKRARVGKVEEFLRNAFKRKRKKIETEAEQASGLSDQICSSLLSVHSGDSGTSNIKDIIDENQNQSERNKNGGESKGPSEAVCETGTADSNARPDKSFEYLQLNDNQVKDGIETSEIKISGVQQTPTVEKRGRGRPRGSFNKKSDKSVTKKVEGRKRGRPRKTPSTDALKNKTDMIEDNLAFVDNVVESKEDEEKSESANTNRIQGENNTVDKGNSAYPENDTDSLSESEKDEKQLMDAIESKGETNYKFSNNLVDSCSIERRSVESGLKDKADLTIVGLNEKSIQFYEIQRPQNKDSSTKTDNIVSFTPKPMTESYNINNLSKVSQHIASQALKSVKEKDVSDGLVKANVLFESSKAGRKNVDYKCKVNEKLSGVRNGSFDEVDGACTSPSPAGNENEEVSLVDKNRFFKTDEISQKYVQNNTNTISSLAQASVTCENIENKVKVDVETADSDTAVPETKSEKDEKRKSIPEDTNLLHDETDSEDESYGEYSGISDMTHSHVEKYVDRQLSLKNKCDLPNEKEAVLSEEEKTRIGLGCHKTEDIEAKTIRYDSDENHMFEPVLSPSERVKMNKRSCKRDVDLTSPVWVKRTKLNKTKVEKKLEVCDESASSKQSQHVQEMSHENDKETCLKVYKGVGKSDSCGPGRGRKRKDSESDATASHSLYCPRSENAKDNMKKNTKVKKC